MKYFIGIVVSLFIAVSLSYATAIDIKNAGDAKFTAKDVTDTTPTFPDFDGTITDQVLDIVTDLTFAVVYTYPLLTLDGSDYVMKTQLATSTYNLGGYNNCRNAGRTKATCIKEIKASIYEQSWATRQGALNSFKSTKDEIAKTDYLSELKLGDVQMSDVN